MSEARPNSDVLTIREAAALLRCSKAHMANIINGKLQGVPPLLSIRAGRRRLIRMSSLQRWMEASEQAERVG
jgi:excisionase family DNA binding protein